MINNQKNIGLKILTLAVVCPCLPQPNAQISLTFDLIWKLKAIGMCYWVGESLFVIQ